MESVRILLDPADFDRIVHNGLPEAGDMTIAMKTQDGPGKAPVILVIGFTAVDTSVDPPIELPVQAVMTAKNFLAVAAALRGFAAGHGKQLE